MMNGAIAGLMTLVFVQAPAAGRAARQTDPHSRLVTSEAELMVAAAASARSDVTILIDRKIVVRRPVYFPVSEAIVRVIGVSDKAAIHFDMVFRGSVERIEEATCNGLEFHCRQAIVANLELYGFEMSGSAIKGHTTELLSVANCHFRDIGTNEYPYRGGKARNASDAVYTQCIGAHNLDRCHIDVVGCRFERCTSNTWQWSHCLYLTARSILIFDNQFTECGNPFCTGGVAGRGSVQIISNRVANPRGGRNQDGVVHSAFLSCVGATDDIIFTRNSITGLWGSGWTGSPNPQKNIIDYNDYGGMRLDAPWAANSGRGEWINWDQWREMGFDRHSVPPVIEPPKPKQ